VGNLPVLALEIGPEAIELAGRQPGSGSLRAVLSRQVPEQHRDVNAAGGQGPTIGREGQTLIALIIVAFEATAFLAGADFKYANGLWVAIALQRPGVARESDHAAVRRDAQRGNAQILEGNRRDRLAVFELQV